MYFTKVCVLALAWLAFGSCGRINFERRSAPDGAVTDSAIDADGAAVGSSDASRDAPISDARLDGDDSASAAASCSDGVQNQDETGIDCGGVCPMCPVSFDCLSVTTIPAIECEALVTLYNSTEGDSWRNNQNWVNAADPCTWSGVICTAGHVSRLELFTNQLNGSIPPELGNLDQLSELVLNDNALVGNIPPELSSIGPLTRLWLNDNQLGGNIPPQLGGLANLNSLLLSGNQLSGSIPAELANLPVTTLWLDDNQLSGSIPPELGSMNNLRALYLSVNQLSGSIPSELGNLPLLGLSLYSNQLSGSIPPALGNLTSCDRFFLHDNRLSGEVPPRLMSLPVTNNFSLYGQTGCLTVTGNPSFEAWLSSIDPSWNDGCP